jgi:hypothetical protein
LFDCPSSGGINRQVIEKLASRNIGLEGVVLLLDAIRFRFNLRQAQHNRPGWPKLGHYAINVINSIQRYHYNIHGALLYPWIPDLCEFRPTPEMFSLVQLEKPEFVTPKIVADYSPQIAFLALRTRRVIPELPVCNAMERSLFNQRVADHWPSGRAEPDFKSFAKAWNNPEQPHPPNAARKDGIFRKTEALLHSYFNKVYLKASRDRLHRAPYVQEFWDILLRLRSTSFGSMDVGSESNIHLRPEGLLAVAQPIVPRDEIESIIRNSVQTYLRGSSAEFQNGMIAPDFLEDGSMPAAMAAQTGNAALEDLVEANMGEPSMEGEASTDTRPQVRLMLKFVRCISQILTQNSPF